MFIRRYKFKVIKQNQRRIQAISRFTKRADQTRTKPKQKDKV